MTGVPRFPVGENHVGSTDQRETRGPNVDACREGCSAAQLVLQPRGDGG